MMPQALPVPVLDWREETCLRAALQPDPKFSWVRIGRLLWPKVRSKSSFERRFLETLKVALEKIKATWESNDQFVLSLRQRYQDLEALLAAVDAWEQERLDLEAPKAPTQPRENPREKLLKQLGDSPWLCSRCGGYLTLEIDHHGPYLDCLACGNHQYPNGGEVPARKIGTRRGTPSHGKVRL